MFILLFFTNTKLKVSTFDKTDRQNICILQSNLWILWWLSFLFFGKWCCSGALFPLNRLRSWWFSNDFFLTILSSQLLKKNFEFVCQPYLRFVLSFYTQILIYLFKFWTEDKKFCLIISQLDKSFYSLQEETLRLNID